MPSPNTSDLENLGLGLHWLQIRNFGKSPLATEDEQPVFLMASPYGMGFFWVPILPNHPHLSKLPKLHKLPQQNAFLFGSRQKSPNPHQCFFLSQHTFNPVANPVASSFRTYLTSNPLLSPPSWPFESKLHPLSPGLTLYPPSWHSASTTIPSSLLLSALPEFLVKDRSDCILPLLKTFSASHVTQKPELIQRPIRSCMICLLPLQSSLNISSSHLPQGLCACYQGS